MFLFVIMSIDTLGDAESQMRYQPESLGAIFRELEGENDRAAIITAASLIEYVLGEVIKLRLDRASEGGDEKRLLEDEGGIAATFSNRIALAYYLRIIGPQVRRDLDLIRRIRNEAAHDMNQVSFANAAIASRCRELRVGEGLDDPRLQYVAACKYYIANLAMRSGAGDAAIGDAFKGLAPDLDL